MTPKDILTQFLEDCGYKVEAQPPADGYFGRANGWSKVRAAHYEGINSILKFPCAIHDDGRIYLSKGIGAKNGFMNVNVHKPDSLKILKEELIAIREQFDKDAAWKRDRK